MHLIAGTSAIVFLLWFTPKLVDAIVQDWQEAVGFAASIVLGGYMTGCLVGLLVNVVLVLLQKN
jgi:hypothetical protein